MTLQIAHAPVFVRSRSNGYQRAIQQSGRR
jgi:hypothetical protein